MIQRVSDFGETGILSLIQSLVRHDSNVQLSLGDDAAVVQSNFQHPMVMASDAMIENTHFHRSWSSGHATARKLVSVNCSDMAAMGAQPRYALLTVGFPELLEWTWVEEFCAGLAEATRLVDLPIVGGDTVGTAQDIVLSMSIVGECYTNKPMCRNGAKPGDGIYVTGPLGLSAYGLRTILERGEVADDSEAVLALLLGKARLSEGRALATWGKCHAAMDLSDGLAQDLPRLAEASDVCLQIDLSSIPLGEDAMAVHPDLALSLAVHGGEDYELVFTASEDPPLPAYRIGQVISGSKGVIWMEGEQVFQQPPAAGPTFTHFSSKSR